MNLLKSEVTELANTPGRETQSRLRAPQNGTVSAQLDSTARLMDAYLQAERFLSRGGCGRHMGLMNDEWLKRSSHSKRTFTLTT